ncbi:phage head closure protein [Helcococcus ovis]|uniref:phage head closure protein n=1 Tax=Helcococcus TaxID=31983 RepID=UPI0038BCE13D
MYTEVITLISKKEEEIDKYGDTVVKEVRRDVFGRLDRIYLSETLQAMSQGFERQVRFRLSDYYDYDNEEELEYEGKRWKVINTQRIGTELEINCTGGVEHGK